MKNKTKNEIIIVCLYSIQIERKEKGRNNLVLCSTDDMKSYNEYFNQMNKSREKRTNEGKIMNEKQWTNVIYSNIICKFIQLKKIKMRFRNKIKRSTRQNSTNTYSSKL